ncbi:unnamed protein product [Spirodela intermedia]|uniref:Uncharacterized protein n=1 Tax=Spirodela intermedia TaxID=51605 RepID=A0ABN7E901_SPIIN|nr:unnamed protein product [Spirodela intermedia]
MADNIEHVISYKLAFDQLHSTALRRLRGHLALGAVSCWKRGGRCAE